LPYRDDLPTVKVSTLRASGAIDAGSAFAILTFGELKRQVGIALRKFPTGGSWSLFICPTCSRRAQTLRLHDGRLVCQRCDGLKWKAHALHARPDINGRVESLQARLKVARKRMRLTLALRKAIIKRRRHQLAKAADELL
jgi:hypothetical protein